MSKFFLSGRPAAAPMIVRSRFSKRIHVRNVVSRVCARRLRTMSVWKNVAILVATTTQYEGVYT